MSTTPWGTEPAAGDSWGTPGPPAAQYAPEAPASPGTLVPWRRRALTTLWDVLYLWPGWVPYLIGTVFVWLGTGAVLTGGDGAILLLSGFLFLLAGATIVLWGVIRNLILDQGRTGYTYGRRKTGTRCIREQDGLPPGTGSCVARYFLHILINYACYIDYLWPLWDDKKQTITDKILTTVVIHDR